MLGYVILSLSCSTCINGSFLIPFDVGEKRPGGSTHSGFAGHDEVASYEISRVN